MYFGHTAGLALTLIISIWLIVAEFDRFQADQLTPYLHNYSDTIVALVEHRLNADSERELQELVRRIGSSDPDAVRITVVAADGRVLADSQGTAAMERPHAAP